MFSILHISDLHRSRQEPVDNDALVVALLADRDRYMGETPVVPSPDAVIVSGDLVQGVPIGQADWQSQMRQQYKVAGEFLDHLVRRFLGGDRSKLIIIPGNHDVCWNTSFNSMEKVPEAVCPPDIPGALSQPDSIFRWSWKDRCLYRIKDGAAYARRLDFYWDFAEGFYAGVPLLTPVDRKQGFHLFELQEKRIAVAAFDSTIGNDCFAFSGAIERRAIAHCALALRDSPTVYDLRIAVWHHSIQGPPKRVDYMDVGQVHEMVGLGFQLGFHGHQHVAAAATHYIHLSEAQAMAVASAGSLCAGANELPRGVNRQYNVVVIEDDYRRARVHVREMTVGEQFSRKAGGAFPQGYAELTWQPNIDVAGREVNPMVENERRAILAAEDALHRSDPKGALALLDGLSTAPGTHARKIACDAALKAENWGRLAALAAEPQNTEEVVLLVTAMTKLNQLDAATAALAQVQDLDPAIRKELEGQIAVRKSMGRR